MQTFLNDRKTIDPSKVLHGNSRVAVSVNALPIQTSGIFSFEDAKTKLRPRLDRWLSAIHNGMWSRQVQQLWIFVHTSYWWQGWIGKSRDWVYLQL